MTGIRCAFYKDFCDCNKEDESEGSRGRERKQETTVTAQETEKRSLKTDQQKQGKKSEKATGVMRGALLKQIVGKTVTRRKKQAEQQGGLRAFTVGTKIPTYLNNLGNTGGFFLSPMQVYDDLR